MDERAKRITYRYIDLLLLSVTGILICCLLQSQLIDLVIWLGKSIEGWSYWIQVAIALMFTAVIWFIIGRLGGVCFRDFISKQTLYNPPVWIFGIISFIIYFFLTLNQLFKDGEYYRTDVVAKAIGITLGIFALGGVIAYIVNFFASEYTERNRRTEEKIDLVDNSKDFDEVIKDPEMLIKWIHKEEPIEKLSQDYFDMAVFARRIAHILKRSPLKTIGLVGRYGCGKSSILNMVKEYLKSSKKLNGYTHEPGSLNFYPSRDIIICWVSGWSFREGTAAQHVLQAAIKQLGKHTDCLSITTLPARYGRAIGDSGNVMARIVGAILCRWQSPINVLKKLDVLLGCIEKRMVIFLEDIDRNKRPDVFFNEISALLDGLKELKHVTFVLAIGEEHKGQEVLVKISENIETIPNLPSRNVINMCKTFRECCLGMLDADARDIFYGDGDKEDRIGWDRSGIVESIAQFEDYLKKPIDYIVELLFNPRVAKAALRRTWQTWQNLYGEIDFDDLLMTNVLRAGATEAFIFINENIKVLRSLSHISDNSETKKRSDKNRAKLHEELKRAAEGTQWDFEAANKLINYLFSGWDDSMRNITLSERLKNSQIVANSEPTDYWARLIREELSPREVRDQEMLSALGEWNKDRQRKVFRDKNMRDALISGQEVLEKARQFKELINEDTLRDQAKEQFQITLQKEKNKASRENCPAVGKWFLLKPEPSSLDSKEWRDWFYEQIKMALPVSLGYANDLYHFWVDPKRSCPIELRSKIIEEAKRIYGGNPEALVKAINPNRFSVRTFAQYFSEVDQGGSGFKPEEWKWLGETLLKAGERNMEVIIPEISILLGDSNPGPNTKTKQGYDYNCKFREDLAHKLFGQKFRQLMELLAKSIDVSMYDTQGKAFIACAQSYARKRLSEQDEGEVDS